MLVFDNIASELAGIVAIWAAFLYYTRPRSRVVTLCGECPHALRRHAAEEGMCLDCPCLGWTPTDA